MIKLTIWFRLNNLLRSVIVVAVVVVAVVKVVVVIGKKVKKSLQQQIQFDRQIYMHYFTRPNLGFTIQKGGTNLIRNFDTSLDYYAFM